MIFIVFVLGLRVLYIVLVKNKNFDYHAELHLKNNVASPQQAINGNSLLMPIIGATHKILLQLLLQINELNVGGVYLQEDSGMNESIAQTKT